MPRHNFMLQCSNTIATFSFHLMGGVDPRVSRRLQVFSMT
jgi:hypothetical protein